MSNQTSKSNLFTSAVKASTAKETKSKVISLPLTDDLEEQLKKYKEAKTAFKNWEGQLQIAEGFIKGKARELYLDECKKQKRNIGSFKLGDVTVSVQDRYAKMEDHVADIVYQNFPDVIESKTEYLLNQEILEKYIDAISDALQSAEGIPQEDLAKLIEAKEIRNVKKGTIDTLPNYADKMSDLFQAISPIISMR
jgi:hypothetical protein